MYKGPQNLWTPEPGFAPPVPPLGPQLKVYCNPKTIIAATTLAESTHSPFSQCSSYELPGTKYCKNLDGPIRAIRFTDRLICAKNLRVPDLNPFFSRRFEAIRANHSNAMSNRGFSANQFLRIDSRESSQFAIARRSI